MSVGTAVLVVLVAVVVAVLGLMMLTGIGARRRGHPIPMAVLEGLAFPLAWAAWYAVDR